MEPYYAERPLNFAHRGASHEAPENTLAAFLLAIELGADGIEFDAQLSSDGQAVVIHDFELEKTTDGTGQVRQKSLAELKELDAGSWFNPDFSGQRIPTLDEVIEAVGQHLLLNIELKVLGDRVDGLARASVRAIEDHQLLDRALVSSFNPWALHRVRRLNPWIRTGLLYSSDMPYMQRRPWLRHLLRPHSLHPNHNLVEGKYASWARQQGYRIHTWTVDDPGRMWKLVGLGVDAIITNKPDVLGQVLSARPGAHGAQPS